MISYSLKKLYFVEDGEERDCLDANFCKECFINFPMILKFKKKSFKKNKRKKDKFCN